MTRFLFLGLSFFLASSISATLPAFSAMLDLAWLIVPVISASSRCSCSTRLALVSDCFRSLFCASSSWLISRSCV